MNNSDRPGDKMYADDLSWREQEVLVLLAERLTNREIAERLHLAETTVKDYVGNILSKLYVKNRRQAVERAKALGLLDREREAGTRPLVNLPAEATPFVGRAQELGEIQRQLAGTRLLTLAGPGGIGKTRLALKAALEAASDFKDGVFFVPLAPIHAVDHLAQTVAEALKFPLATHEDPQQQLLRYLRKKQLLLVMDNFEHLLDGAGIVSQILVAAPAVKVLATSRETLNLQSETVFNVGGMAFPCRADPLAPPNYDAVDLFVQSAGKVRLGFKPPPGEMEQIARICQIVGGMPLAIELAAAWLHILNVDEIAGELKKGLDILASERRDAPERHRSIRAVFDHSWRLLDQAEREIFLRLSIFRGGFTREAAQQVTGASLGQLGGLVNKSLLSHNPHSSRLEVHELLRQYAEERLEESPQAGRDAHAAYYAAFMQSEWADVKGSRQLSALAEIEADIENVRAAWRYALERRNSEQIWKFIYGLWHVYWIRSWNLAGVELFGEAVAALQKEQDEESTALCALAMALQGYFMAWLGIPERGCELAEQSARILEQLNQPEALWFAYEGLSINAYMLDRLPEQLEAVDKLVEIATHLNDPWLKAFMLFAPSMVALVTEDYAEARRLAELNLNLYEEIGDVIGATMPLIILGHVALAGGDYAAAQGFYARCLEIAQGAGFNYSIQTSSKYLGKVLLSMGEYAQAEYYLLQCLTLSKEVGFVRDVINLLSEFARLYTARGDPERAVELLGVVIRHPASDQTRWLEGRIRDSARDLLAELESELPPETYKAALARGRGLELETAVEGVVADRQ
ncbi:MAG: AAA family ATPase [Anaerolineales bacterium]|nr:AAA family ATPase [Anaerolineales bacterium]